MDSKSDDNSAFRGNMRNQINRNSKKKITQLTFDHCSYALAKDNENLAVTTNQM